MDFTGMTGVYEIANILTIITKVCIDAINQLVTA